MRKLLWTLPIVLTLAACSSASDTTVTTGCTDAIAAIGEVAADDFEAEDAAITASTQKCATADEYVQAVKANPGAWLYKSAKDVNEDLLIASACTDNADQAMCKDAKEQGLLK